MLKVYGHPNDDARRLIECNVIDNNYRMYKKVHARFQYWFLPFFDYCFYEALIFFITLYVYAEKWHKHIMKKRHKNRTRC